MSPADPGGRREANLVDARGPRFAASVTTVVLVLVLLLAPSVVAVVLLAGQLVVFALGSILGLRYSPYGAIFRIFVRPRLGPPREWEDEAPPRFAQTVGVMFAAVGVLAFLLGWDPVGLAAVSAALAAAFLNAAFGYCLGCELYLLLARLRHSS